MIKCYKVIFFYILALLFFSTYTKFVKSAEELKTDYQYFLDGMYYYSDKSYTSAAEEFEKLSRNYPYSPYTHNSLLMELYTNYINSDKEKIDGVAEIFYRLYPLDEELPYVMYIHAMSFYAKIKSEVKTYDLLSKSEKMFMLLIQKYPDSKYAKDAKQKLDYIHAIKQLYDLRIAERYYKLGRFVSAFRRYAGMFHTYEDKLNTKIEENILCNLSKLSSTLKLDEEAMKYKNMLLKKYPYTGCFNKTSILNIFHKKSNNL